MTKNAESDTRKEPTWRPVPSGFILDVTSYPYRILADRHIAEGEELFLFEVDWAGGSVRTAAGAWVYQHTARRPNCTLGVNECGRLIIASEPITSGDPLVIDGYEPDHLPDGLSIRPSRIEGLGLWADSDLGPTDSLGITRVRCNNSWVRPALGGWVNHSDSPNAQMVQDDQKAVLALHETVGIGEITVRYQLYTPQA